jgi:hypothetical protein
MRCSMVHVCECPACQVETSDENASIQALHHQMNLFFARLDEAQRRWYAALESRRLGHGGDRQITRILGLSEKSIRRGRREVDADLATCPADRIREPGGGRPAAEERNPALESTLEQILVPETAGSPQSAAKYKRSFLRHLSTRLSEGGHPASRTAVGRLLRKPGYSPKVNARRKEAKAPPRNVTPSSATSSSRSGSSWKPEIR